MPNTNPTKRQLRANMRHMSDRDLRACIKGHRSMLHTLSPAAQVRVCTRIAMARATLRSRW